MDEPGPCPTLRSIVTLKPRNASFSGFFATSQLLQLSQLTMLGSEHNGDMHTEPTTSPLCMMVRRCEGGTAPEYLAAHLAPVSETAQRQHLRSATSHQLRVQPHRRTTYRGRAFAVAGLSTWNLLPKCLRDPSHSISVFGSVFSALEALALMRYINLRFTLHYCIRCVNK